MGTWERRFLRITMALILAVGGVVLAAAVLAESIYGVLASSGMVVLGLYWFYLRYYRGRKPSPLAPPDGSGDIYFPRTNIPRPLYEDLRKMREEKVKLSKTSKKTRRSDRKD